MDMMIRCFNSGWTNELTNAWTDRQPDVFLSRGKVLKIWQLSFKLVTVQLEVINNLDKGFYVCNRHARNAHDD